MATYVMSDIHGCLNEVKEMLNVINFTDADKLIFAGDYTDRGPQNIETLKWVETAPKNMTFLRGNHDDGFIKYVNALVKAEEKHNLPKSEIDEIYFRASISRDYFDTYGTIRELLYEKGVSIDELIKYKTMLENMPYLLEMVVNNKNFIIVHGGYIDEKDFEPSYYYPTINDYYVWAREEAYLRPDAGKKDTIIISGHTPTIISGEFSYTGGTIYKQHNKNNNSTLYDIDCGCTYAFGGYEESSLCRLACIRLEDEKIFYVKPRIK